MIVPDAQAIVRVRLAALGFRTAWRTAHQLQQLLHAADTCLSPLPTYDWGLRTAIAIVRGVASELHQRHAAMLAREDTEHDVPPDSFGLTAQDEVEVVAHTLCQLVLPSLSEDDTKPFLDLVALMFPASAAVTDNNNARTRAVRAALTEAAAASMFVSGEAWCAKGLQVPRMQRLRLPAFLTSVGCCRGISCIPCSIAELVLCSWVLHDQGSPCYCRPWSRDCPQSLPHQVWEVMCWKAFRYEKCGFLSRQ